MFPLLVIAFLCGDLYLQTFATLPHVTNVWLLFLLIIIARFTLAKFKIYFYFLFAAMLGFAWSLWYAELILSWQLPKEIEGKPVYLTGYIASLPIQAEWGVNFILQVKKIVYQNKNYADKVFIKTTWPGLQTQVHVGDEYQFLVKLKRIHSSQNPGGFDYEAWALQHKIRAQAYIIKNQAKLLKHAHSKFLVNRFRQILQIKITQLLPQSPTSIWLYALLIGEHIGAKKTDWQVLRNTGTNHLMAIAGLHIGIIAGMVGLLVNWSWRRSQKLILFFPAKLAASFTSLCAAILYSLIAGFSLPAQRASIMLSVFIFALLSRKQINAWHSWSLAMLFVLLLNPISVLTESFWLSFGTIALIIFCMQNRLAVTSWWWKWGRVQWIIGIGLIPFTLILFQQCSFISFIANCIAIPWLTFFILPFCFMSYFFIFTLPSVAAFILMIADLSLSILWMILTWLSHFQFAVWHQGFPSITIMLLTSFGFLILLLPSGYVGKYFGLFWLLPIVFWQAETPATSNFWLTVLDVGQGLAVIVQTKHHVLVYDAGPRFGSNFDAGESIVLPYLSAKGIQKIDTLIISHGDNDHIGGAYALVSTLPIKKIITSAIEKLFDYHAQPCIAGDSWQWDKVKFMFIYPNRDELNLGNDGSCVLRIDNGKYSVLLPGDIEKAAQKNLVNRGYLSRAEVLLAPHHGSKTSALNEFINNVQPKFVIYAVGYRNRYAFPHPDVVIAYKKIGAMALDTSSAGTIEFKFDNKLKYEMYRIKYKHYWLDS